LQGAETLQLAPPQLSIPTANLILGRPVDYEHDSRIDGQFFMLTAPQEAHFLLPAVMLAPHFGHPLWDIFTTSSSMVGLDGSCYIGSCRLRVCMAGFCQLPGTVCKLSTSITPTGKFSTSSRLTRLTRLRHVRENCGGAGDPQTRVSTNCQMKAFPQLAPRTSQQHHISKLFQANNNNNNNNNSIIPSHRAISR
jgi:hypothetical protein